MRMMERLFTRVKAVAGGIVANLLLSWIVLPFVIPPFGLYSLRDLGEVLLWQGIAMIGWPLALFGGIVSFLFQPGSAGLGALLVLLIYPAMLVLLILVLSSKPLRPWALVLFHVVLTLSFAAVWYQVLNGYDFQVG